MLNQAPGELLRQAKALLERQAELEDRWNCGDPLCDGLPHPGWTHHHARGTQHEPDTYETWLVKTGRGWGKTRVGSETVKSWARFKPVHVAVIGKTDRDVRNICFEGPSGLLNVIRDKYVADYKRTTGDTSLTLANGSVFRAFSAERPESLRGYAFDGGWCDEYGAWTPMSALDTWDNLWFALRGARFPHVLVTTTPRGLEHVRHVVALADVVTHGHTDENIANLSRAAVAVLERRYGGTRLGRQELSGELIEEIEGALWTWGQIEDNRVEAAPDLWRIVVAIDPATTTTGDLTGIVVAGIGGDRTMPHLYVLEDASGHYTPDGWARRAADLHDKWLADCIVGEVNQGGDMVASVLRQVAPHIVFHSVHATRGKHVRAEPIHALYEQGRGHHVGNFAELEDQQTTWTVDSRESPDRIDALVWAGTDLLRFGAATVFNPARLRLVRGGEGEARPYARRTGLWSPDQRSGPI